MYWVIDYRSGNEILFVVLKQALRGLAPGITALSWIVSFVGNTFSHGPCQWR